MNRKFKPLRAVFALFLIGSYVAMFLNHATTGLIQISSFWNGICHGTTIFATSIAQLFYDDMFATTIPVITEVSYKIGYLIGLVVGSLLYLWGGFFIVLNGFYEHESSVGQSILEIFRRN